MKKFYGRPNRNFHFIYAGLRGYVETPWQGVCTVWCQYDRRTNPCAQDNVKATRISLRLSIFLNLDKTP